MSDPRPDFPGSIRAVVPHPWGGHVAMAGFPGLEIGIDGSAVFDPDLCRETIRGLYDAGARTLVVLVEGDELDQIGFDLLWSVSAEIGIDLIHQPIVDYSVPSEQLMTWWTETRARRRALFETGNTLAFSCHHGAGRSGLMAAWSLIEAGISADEAIAQLRAQFPEAVESEAQEAWLSDRAISDGV